ncbi:MAG: beta-ketoacyl-[acyl-carrier-protein] synthase family protein [Chloroflexi bacterium]|nr:MAG: beta-ketoacyl-[acyl-carrier-protein] synthase family protein [Chloroflexota bacterium]
MTERVVAITGIGTLTPAGRGTEALWATISSGRACLTAIDPQNYFDPSPYACQIAGQVPSFDEPRVLTASMMAQTDRCSQMALVAALDALDEARLPMDFRSERSPVAPERVSLAVATVAAGWTYVEREMRNLWTKGVGAMDRYALTAGFPAGPQGHVGILFGVEGRTRTFVSERASGAHALIEGAKAIQRGDAEIVIAGGTEAPLTPLVWAAYHASNMLQPTSEGADQHTGMFIGEGSTFLILEEREHAIRRDVPILAEIRGWSRGTDAYPLGASRKQPSQKLVQIIHASLAQAHIHPAAVDVIFPAGPALPAEDVAEEAALKCVFDGEYPRVAIPKAILGHLQGAAVATDVAIAVLALGRQVIPPTQDSLLPTDLMSTNECTASFLKHALVLSCGLGGMHASLVISRPE